MMWTTSADRHGPLNNNSSTSAPIDLEQLLGPRRFELYKVVPITVIYAVIFATGVVGNLCTAVVIWRNKYMHTATNYYLCNLAVSDLLFLALGLPVETYSFWSAYPWIFGETFCVLRTAAAETSTNASILTITAFTVERYVAICHPMRAKTMSSLSRAVRTVVVVWLVAGCCSIPIWIQFGVVYEKDADGRPIADSALCAIGTEMAHLQHFFDVSSVVFFIIPMIVISVLYALIACSIRRSALERSASDDSGGGEAGGLGGSMASGSSNFRGRAGTRWRLRHRAADNQRTEIRRVAHQIRARLAVVKMLGAYNFLSRIIVWLE